MASERTFDALVAWLAAEVPPALQACRGRRVRLLLSVHDDDPADPKDWGGRAHALFRQWAAQGLGTFKDTHSRVPFPDWDDVVRFVGDSGLTLTEETEAELRALYDRNAARANYGYLCDAVDAFLDRHVAPDKPR